MKWANCIYICCIESNLLKLSTQTSTFPKSKKYPRDAVIWADISIKQFLQDKQIEYLEKRLLQMKKMKTVLENTIVPGPLANVEAVVSASDQLTVSWKDIRQRSKDLVVNYKGLCLVILSC